jgi:hypothetical protein
MDLNALAFNIMYRTKELHNFFSMNLNYNLQFRRQFTL